MFSHIGPYSAWLRGRNGHILKVTHQGAAVRSHDVHAWLTYCRGTARRSMSVEILSTAAHDRTKIAFEEACNRRVTLKVTQGDLELEVH